MGSGYISFLLGSSQGGYEGSVGTSNVTITFPVSGIFSTVVASASYSNKMIMVANCKGTGFEARANDTTPIRWIAVVR